jgi:nucleolar protein 56
MDNVLGESNTITIIETIIGLFAVIKGEKIITYSLYPVEAKKIVDIFNKHDEGLITPELEKMLQTLVDGGYKRIGIPSEALANSVKKKRKFLTPFLVEKEADNQIRKRIFDLAKELHGLEEDEYLHLSHQVSDMLSKQLIRGKLAEKETLIVQTVQLLGEIDVILNNLYSRLREWYGLHFPELGLRVKDHQTYVNIVAKIGERSLMDLKKLHDVGLEPGQSRNIVKLAETSMGAPLSQRDIMGMKELAKLITSLQIYRETLSEYIEDITENIAPNVSTLAGPLLTAKLIENAGSLKRMAMLPSSTIQVLGAGKAMFRTIKTGAKPPKHGLLFQHAYVNRANRKERGKRARKLAGKIAIASRADYFSGNYIADKLKEQLSKGKK